MTRAVVNVATTPYYQRGQARLTEAVGEFGCHALMLSWPCIPALWRDHETVPYGFKAYALETASDGADLLLWSDSSILPIRSMEPLWERIERDGYWFSANGYNNYEWTAQSAYPDLFPECYCRENELWALNAAAAINANIPHVVATVFGLNVKHPKGKAFLDEYFRLASETNAFCGPWINANHPDWLAQPGAQRKEYNVRVAPCGPPDVRGHRHDQVAASVIAWRLGMELTTPPVPFSYGKAGDTFDEGTILIADGSYL